MSEKEVEVQVDPLAGLTEGRIVHFVMPNEQHRPAIVVRVWDRDHVNGCSQLQVFTDGSNDIDQWVKDSQGNARLENLEAARYGLLWKTSVLFSEKHDPGTWHWIERA